jgi:hypothetical protein
MFQFPTCPSRGLCIQPPMPALARRQVAPFGSDRLIARLQLPGHVSPLSAPFVGTQPLRHPPCTLLRLALTCALLHISTPQRFDTILCLVIRFGKIEVIPQNKHKLIMRLSKNE